MELKKKLISVVVCALSLGGCTPPQRVIVECRRPDGQLAFYGPATRLTYEKLRRTEELYSSWVIYNSDGFGGIYYIPAECSCTATNRGEK